VRREAAPAGGRGAGEECVRMGSAASGAISSAAAGGVDSADACPAQSALGMNFLFGRAGTLRPSPFAGTRPRRAGWGRGATCLRSSAAASSTLHADVHVCWKSTFHRTQHGVQSAGCFRARETHREVARRAALLRRAAAVRRRASNHALRLVHVASRWPRCACSVCLHPAVLRPGRVRCVPAPDGYLRVPRLGARPQRDAHSGARRPARSTCGIAQGGGSPASNRAARLARGRQAAGRGSSSMFTTVGPRKPFNKTS
jgi:hypothetical protein